jgi:hypothetical protein
MCSGCCRGVYDGLGLVCVGFVSFSVFLRFCVLVLVLGVLSPCVVRSTVGFRIFVIMGVRYVRYEFVYPWYYFSR